MSIENTAGQVLFADEALLPEGWAENVRIDVGADGRIAGVGSGAAQSADAQHVPILLPAVCNLHSHTFQRGMAGLAEARGPSGRDSFWTWREIMYRFLDILDPEDIETIAAFAFMEMQEAGFAAVAEFHYLHNQPGGAPYDNRAELASRIAAAAQTTGIGLTLLPVHYRQGGVDGRPLAGGQLRFGNDLDSFGRLTESVAGIVSSLPADAGMGIAPHSLRAVSAGDLARLATMRPEDPFHMHLAEQTAEIEEMLAVHGARPVTWLLDNCDVDSRWCLIHCTHMTSEETGRLAETGAAAGLCPVTEANLGDGVFDGVSYLKTGGRFGVGTDSNIRISMAEELRQFEYSQRLRDQVRVAVAGPGQSSGRVLYDHVLAAGAQALGRDSGSIATGKWADLLALDPARLIGARSGDGWLDSWIFTASNDAIANIWSAGRHVVRNGRHVARADIEPRYRKAMRGIMDRL